MIINILFKKWQKNYKKGLTKALPYGIIRYNQKIQKERGKQNES